MQLIHFFIYLNLILIFILLCQNNVLKGGDILANSDSSVTSTPTGVPTPTPTGVPTPTPTPTPTGVPTPTPTPTDQEKIEKLQEELALLQNPHKDIIEKVENIRDWCKTNFEKIMNVQDDRLDDTRMVCNSIL